MLKQHMKGGRDLDGGCAGFAYLSVNFDPSYAMARQMATESNAIHGSMIRLPNGQPSTI